MNDLAIIVGSYGRIGSLERIMPEYLPSKEDKVLLRSNGAVGMIRTSRVTRDSFSGQNTPDDEILASFIISRDDSNESELTEFHGVVLFKPLDGIRWQDQIEGIKTKPSMFEVVSPLRLESNSDYAFYAQRTLRTSVRGRKRL